jgi:hypothetical protein
LVVAVALVKILGWVERAGNAAVAVAVAAVDMKADTGSVAMHMCGRTKARVGVSSEVEDGPFRWDSCMMAVLSASESVGDALSSLLPKMVMVGQIRTAMMLDVVLVVQAPSDESLVK